MYNKNVQDFVAESMEKALKSDSYKTLFGTVYKYASDENAAKDACEKCEKDTCECDSAAADDVSFAADEVGQDESDADDNLFASDKDEEEVKAEAAFDTAIDSLLTASAALDAVGMERSSALSLKIASIVVEAKKKDKEAKKDKSKDKDAKDKQEAKDKAKAAKAKEDAKKAKEKEDLAKKKAKDKEKADAQSAKDKASKEKEKAKAKEKADKEKADKEKAKAKFFGKK